MDTINDIIESDWTPVDHEIKRMLLNFPTLYQSRNDCRIHFFSSGGTGYDWNLETGEFENFYRNDEKERTTPRFEKIKDDENGFIKMRQERINVLRQFDFDNINLIVKDFYGECSSSFKTRGTRSLSSIRWSDEKHESCWGPMQYACKYKDQIADHWRHEIRDFCKWIIKDIRSFVYSPSQEKASTNEEIIEKLGKMDFRVGHEMKSSYICALNVYNGILTDKEKEQEERHRLSMVKMFDDILKK